MTDIIDISKHQGDVNFKTAIKNGVRAVMMRASYGGAKDIKFDEFYKKAVAEKIPVGVYLFATWHYHSLSPDYETARKNAVSQTRKALSFLSGKTVTAPVAIDMELEKNAQLKFSKAQLTDLVNLAISEVKKAGYKPLVYSSVSWFFDRLEAERINCPLWVAYYYKGAEKDEFPDTKYGRQLSKLRDKLALWQYSSTGSGESYGTVSQYVDENYCYDEKLFGIENPKSSAESVPTEEKSLYTVKIRQGSWYVRKLNSTSSAPIKIIRGGVTLQASQKKNGWFYLTLHKGWIGPAAIVDSGFNRAKSHRVKSGETLTSISEKYGVSIEEILSKNIKKYPKITKNYIQAGWALDI